MTSTLDMLTRLLAGLCSTLHPDSLGSAQFEDCATTTRLTNCQWRRGRGRKWQHFVSNELIKGRVWPIHSLRRFILTEYLFLSILSSVLSSCILSWLSKKRKGFGCCFVHLHGFSMGGDFGIYEERSHDERLSLTTDDTTARFRSIEGHSKCLNCDSATFAGTRW